MSDEVGVTGSMDEEVMRALANLDDVTRALDSHARELKGLRELVLAYNPRIREFEDRLDGVERQLSALNTRMDAAEARPDPMEDELIALHRADESQAQRIAALEAARPGAGERDEEVRRAVDGLSGGLDGLRADIDGLRKAIGED